MSPSVNGNEIQDADKPAKSGDLPPVVEDRPPKVLISGAGLAGLFLANLLEVAGIPYAIFERAKEVLPLGSIICLTANILPAFEQLGIYDELMKFAYPCLASTFYSSKLEVIGSFRTDDDEKLIGYHRTLFPRPELYQLLLSRIPAEKVHMSKKLMSFVQNKDGVMVRLQDGSTVHGDILVGADGAHSAVRHNMFEDLLKRGLLPKADQRKMMKGFICMVGTTDELDPAKFPGVDNPYSAADLILGDSESPYSWSIYNTPGNRICWNVIVQLDVDASEDEQFRNSEWSATTNESLIKEVYEFKTPFGKLGDLIDKTPRDRISKVFLEDILYQTWSHGRAVIIGDAAHKLLPSTGQGAVNGLQDAVILANCLYDLRPLSYEGIQETLKDFQAQRFSHVKTQYEASQFNAKLRYGHTFLERTLRHVVFNYMPKSIQMKQLLKDSAYRPQIAFLPEFPKKGSSAVLPQKPSKRYMEEQKKKAQAQTQQ
ncbi:hypothetical protein BGZ98_005231 [Dissophora globulifera]|nr:hypothetical protein BGZ98_005231 [Dissophora globulifera]